MIHHRAAKKFAQDLGNQLSGAGLKLLEDWNRTVLERAARSAGPGKRISASAIQGAINEIK